MSTLQPRRICILFLTMTLLACTLKTTGTPAPALGNSRVDKLGASTTAEGAVRIVINYTRGPEATVTLTCTYPREDGNLRQYTYVDERPLTDARDANRTDALNFVFKKPGTYEVTCQIGDSKQSASFTIATLATP